MTLRVLGLALIEKSSDTGALTASEMVVAWLAEEIGRATCRERVQTWVEDAAVRVKVELPPAVTAVGLNVAVAPARSPLELTVAVCSELLTTAVLMVLVALCP